MRHVGEVGPRALRAVAVATLVVATLAGCRTTDTVSGCTSADQSLLDELSAAARTGTSGPGDLDVDRVEVGRTVVVDLPESLRKFGADRLLASRASVFDAHPPSSDFPGIEVDAFVAVSSDGELVAPVGKVTAIGFDIAGPDDPSWQGWAKEVADSSEADKARSCVDPHA